MSQGRGEKDPITRLTRHVLAFAAIDGEAFCRGDRFYRCGYVVQLQGAATAVCLVRRRAVVQSPVPEQYAAGLQGDGGDAVAGDVGVAYLPVASFEVYHRPFAMALGNDMHTPVFGIGGVEGKPMR